MKKWMKASLIVLLALVLCVPMFACSPRGASVSFTLDRAAFVRAAQEALEAGSGEDVKRPIGVYEIWVWPDPSGEGDCVEFQVGGAGLGSTTSYWGVMFCRSGPLGFQGVSQDHVPDGDGWLWEEPDGDNWSRIVPLEENWYLYEMRF